MAQQLLEQSASKLKEQNTETMTGITQPLKDAIANMQKAINDNQKESAAHSASFREQMLMMMQQTQQLGEKAESLTNVLRRDNKVSGNMGEIILGDLLTSQGLTEGIHYEVQARLRDELGRPMKHDETGREMQPDVILHYPQGQDAIIDSKVSLVAYEKYVNAESPEDKDRYLQDHIKSVRQHVNELARKDYSKYVKNGRDVIDFVIMFVPFESSLQLALANDPTLWREAFEKKVFVTGEQNLLGILHMIHIAWVQNQQAENQEKVFGLAEQLLDRLGDFVQRYNDLGAKIEAVQKAYDNTNNKLITGRQSVTQKAQELITLGAKENPNRKIPVPEVGLE
jgi:DNA recombination protein RmuC